MNGFQSPFIRQMDNQQVFEKLFIGIFCVRVNSPSFLAFANGLDGITITIARKSIYVLGSCWCMLEIWKAGSCLEKLNGKLFAHFANRESNSTFAHLNIQGGAQLQNLIIGKL